MTEDPAGRINLPPRPEALSGEPHPPTAPREWHGHPGETERDPRRFGPWPKEHGPLLECYVPTGRSGVFTALTLLVVMIVGLTITTGDAEWMSIWWMWSFVLLVIPMGFSATTGSKCAAGAEWFQHKKRWVRQYELTSVTIRMRFSNRYLRLTDRNHRTLTVFLGDIQQNQRLWDLVYNGIQHSVHNGANTNWIARRALQLPHANQK